MSTRMPLKTEVIYFAFPISGNRFDPLKFLNKRSINLIPRILWALKNKNKKKNFFFFKYQNRENFKFTKFWLHLRLYFEKLTKCMSPFTLINNVVLLLRVGKGLRQIICLSTIFKNALWQVRLWKGEGRLFEMRS